MERRIFWQKPKLRTDEDEGLERKVTWLELFYDLVFVVVIAVLSRNLSGHITKEGIIGFILLFIPVWWVWIADTYYNERFETEGIENRVFTFLQMLPVVGLAVFANDALGETSAGFALSYVAARIIFMFLWLRGVYHNKPMWPLMTWHAVGFGISASLFFASIFFPTPLRFVMWGIGLLFDLFTPITTLKHQKKLPQLSSSKLPERYGLFVIIVLGESITGVVHGMANNHDLTINTFLTAVLGMTLTFGLWWVYFDFIAKRPPKPIVWFTLPWSYLHLLLIMSFVAFGAGILNVVSEAGFDILPLNVYRLLTVTVAISLITMGFLELTLRRDPFEPTHPVFSPATKFITGALVLCFGFMGAKLGPISTLLILMAFIMVNIIYGMYAWFTQDIPTEGVM
jgi:low temperature requirement protein LtrA